MLPYFFRNDSQVVLNLDDVYNVGTFVQIHELQDVGDRLRLVVMAHRRIKIVKQIEDVPEEAPEGSVFYSYTFLIFPHV